MLKITLLSTACLLPLSLGAHESFLNPHPHNHASHAHGHDHPHAGHDHAGHDHSKKSVEIHPPHEAHGEPRIHVTTGARYTEYDTEEGDAHLLETGLGLAVDVTDWLQLTVDGRYGWFDSDFASEDGWLPVSTGVEAHIPVAEHWELGVGLRTQFPGEEPLGADEWEVSPEIEVRYDRGSWYAGFAGELSWVLSQGDHEHDHADHDHHDHHDHDEHEGEHHEEGEEAHHAEHVDLHEIIEPHGETEFVWQTAIGARFLEERLTLEARLKGYHVIQGETEDPHYLRGGLRSIYDISENLAFIVDGSLPLTDARRNDFQISAALRVSF